MIRGINIKQNRLNQIHKIFLVVCLAVGAKALYLEVDKDIPFLLKDDRCYGLNCLALLGPIKYEKTIAKQIRKSNNEYLIYEYARENKNIELIDLALLVKSFQ